MTKPSAPRDLPGPAEPLVPAAVVRDLKAAGVVVGGGYQTDHSADGAIPNGTRVRKCLMEEGDANPVGTLGTVEGSMGPVPHPLHGNMYGYFVRWDTMPYIQVFVAGKKVERA
jgi:hypothetical protein